MNPENLTEAEIQEHLAKESARGPRHFRGKPLAPYTAGIRDLAMKVLNRADTDACHDLTVIKLLTESHGESKDERVAKRQALISSTDNVAAFRAAVSVEFLDELTDAEIREAREIVDSILAPVAAAEVTVSKFGAKKKERAPGPSRTKKRS
jgi:hypothetical protein